MSPNRIVLPLLLAALVVGACGPAVTPTAAPPTPTTAPPTPTAAPPLPTTAPPLPTAAPPQPTTAPPTPAPGTPTLLPTEPPGLAAELVGQAGLTYTPIPGYTVAYDWNRVLLTAPNADPSTGPLVVIDSNAFQCYESIATSLPEAFERARDCLPWMYNVEDYEITEPVEVNVDDRFGYAADINGTIAGQKVRLHFIVLKPGTMRVVVAVALAPAARYAEVAGPFENLVASIDLLTWTIYSNANGAQDVAFFEGYLWTATGGGVVNYGLGGGLLPEKYTTVDGLPANDARALVVCPVMGEAVLIAGTWGGGLAWFDMGQRRWFDMGGAYTEWHGDDVRALACAPDRRRLVVGYDDGVDIYDADEVLWTFIPAEMGLPGGLRTLLVSPDGATIWAVGRQEAARISGYEVASFALPSGDYLGQAALDGAGGLWVGTDAGIAQLSPAGDWTLYHPKDFPGLAVGPVSGLVVAPDGAVWAGSEGQVARFDPLAGQVTAVYTRAQGLGAGWVTRMAAQEDGWIAAGSATGTSVWRDGEWTFYNLEDEPLLANWITALVQDRGGAVWVGTATGGVYRFDPRHPAGPWDNFYSALPDPSVAALYADPEGGVWVGHVGGVSHYDGQNWEHPPALDGLYAYDMAEDDRGRLWIAGDMGVGIWDGQTLTWLTAAAGLPADQARALLPDGAAMWVGTLGGLARVTGDRIETLTTENSDLPDNAVHALALDPLGRLLAAAGPYLAWYDKDLGRFSILFENYDGNDVVAIGVAANGEHWLTTRGDGAYHLIYQGEGADWVHVRAVEGPPANDYLPHSILVDRDGAVWLGGATGGVARYGK